MKHTETGFTFIELIVTLVIIAIIASVAIPSMKNLMVNMRINQTVAIIKDALEQARVESFITQKQVTVQIHNNQIIINSARVDTNLLSGTKTIYLTDPHVAVVPKNGVGAGVYFNRGIPQNATGVPLGGLAGAGYEICYQGEQVQKQMVKFEGRNTITVLKNLGACQ